MFVVVEHSISDPKRGWDFDPILFVSFSNYKLAKVNLGVIVPESH